MGLTDAFDRVAQDYQARYAGNPQAQALSRALDAELERWLRPGASLLDVGCGPGTHALPLARRGYRIQAVDSAPEMLAELARQAQREGLPIELHSAAAESLRLSSPVEAAIAIHGPFGYQPDPRPLGQSLARALLPGARLWVGLARAASLPQLGRRPWRALAPLWRSPFALPAQLAGQPLVVHLWDPRAFARALADSFALESFTAIGLGVPLLETQLRGRRLLRHLGHSTLLRFRRR